MSANADALAALIDAKKIIYDKKDKPDQKLDEQK